LHEAVGGAADKLTRLVESTLGRLRNQRNRASAPPPAEPENPAER
jgi:hypothetical protein